MPVVDSDAIARAEYDAPTRTLFVHFTRGAWYAYLDVAPGVFTRMTAASSKGCFFQDEVRGRYAHLKLDVSASRR